MAAMEWEKDLKTEIKINEEIKRWSGHDVDLIKWKWNNLHFTFYHFAFVVFAFHISRDLDHEQADCPPQSQVLSAHSPSCDTKEYRTAEPVGSET